MRTFLVSVRAIAAVTLAIVIGISCEFVWAAEPLFPTDLPSREWAQFKADGFSCPVTGIIYQCDKPVSCGVPLGGIDTGCLDLETSGLWGYCSLFNSLYPRRGPLNIPFLGLSVGGQTWVLCDPSHMKKHDYDGRIEYPAEPYPTELRLDGVKTVKDIRYWGHYPIADLEYETDAPIGVGLRAWSVFLPGDVDTSMLPGMVFEVHLRNPSDTAQEGTIAFSFPGPSKNEAGSTSFEREKIGRDDFNGVAVKSQRANYALGIVGGKTYRLGGELGADGPAWAAIHERLPVAKPDEPGSSLAVDFSLKPHESKIVRYVVTWYCPQWQGGDSFEAVIKKGNYIYKAYPWSETGPKFTHMYSLRYGDAVATASLLARDHDKLLKRILAWQEVIYKEKNLPGWLQDSLINVLHLITEDGLWAAAGKPLPDWVKPEDGLFGMSESPRSCPQIECIPCSFYGNVPLVYFFPRLALSSLRGYKGYQFPNGAPPWLWGCDARFDDHVRGVQESLTGLAYVAMVDRYGLCWGNDQFANEFFDSVKRATEWTANGRPSYEIGDAVISMPSGSKPTDHWFERDPGWFGMVPHIGGLHLAQFRIAERMAEKTGDKEFAQQCETWIKAGQTSLESKCWLGDYYLTYWEPETGKRSDQVFGYQLDGQWVADFHGLPAVFPKNHVDATLETIKRCNVALSKSGAVNFANPNGTLFEGDAYGSHSYFQAEALMLAMTYMYNGQREFGMDLARRCWENVACTWGRTWNLPNRTSGGPNDECVWTDYYQCLMLWSLPAVIEGGDIALPCRPGGLVDRILQSAKTPGN